MKTAQYFKLTLLGGFALMAIGLVRADDLPLPTDPAQQREKMQERYRNMTPEDQQLMRQTSSDGRTNMKQNQGDATNQRSRDGSGKGGGYGQGYESRRGTGAGSGSGSGQGGKHGMGGGRG